MRVISDRGIAREPEVLFIRVQCVFALSTLLEKRCGQSRQVVRRNSMGECTHAGARCAQGSDKVGHCYKIQGSMYCRENMEYAAEKQASVARLPGRSD